MKSSYFTGFLKGIVLIQLFMVIIIAGVSLDINGYFIKPDFKNILLPFMDIGLNNNQVETLFSETNYLLAGANAGLISKVYSAGQFSEDIMAANIPVLAYTDNERTDGEGLEVSDSPEITVEEDQTAAKLISENNALFKGHKVVFYCTHSAESYIPDSGKAKLDGKRGLVNKVAETMSKELESIGIDSEFINTIHDFPDYNSSYTRSRETVKKLLSSDQNILAIFDVHRDSVPGANDAPVVRVQGKECAQILIIVGTNQRKTHPNWQKNYQFAQKLYEQAEKMYPGLIKGIRTKGGTYNQEFHSHALLLEMGSDRNTLQEACNTGKLFSQVLAEVLKEEK